MVQTRNRVNEARGKLPKERRVEDFSPVDTERSRTCRGPRRFKFMRWPLYGRLNRCYGIVKTKTKIWVCDLMQASVNRHHIIIHRNLNRG